MHELSDVPVHGLAGVIPANEEPIPSYIRHFGNAIGVDLSILAGLIERRLEKEGLEAERLRAAIEWEIGRVDSYSRRSGVEFYEEGTPVIELLESALAGTEAEAK
jgi:hypothetical protein